MNSFDGPALEQNNFVKNYITFYLNISFFLSLFLSCVLSLSLKSDIPNSAFILLCLALSGFISSGYLSPIEITLKNNNWSLWAKNLGNIYHHVAFLGKKVVISSNKTYLGPIKSMKNYTMSILYYEYTISWVNHTMSKLYHEYTIPWVYNTMSILYHEFTIPFVYYTMSILYHEYTIPWVYYTMSILYHEYTLPWVMNITKSTPLCLWKF